MTLGLFGGEPARSAGYIDPPARVGFFTDTSICIGCKACEVACKEWNRVPDVNWEFSGNSYDNTGGLGANAWRHVAFIEQRRRPVPTPGPPDAPDTGPPPIAVPISPAPLGSQSLEDALGLPGPPAPVGLVDQAQAAGPDGGSGLRWLMSSDVCKHCTSAACLNVCPTGSLMRTEFGTVVVQQDICNGCGYCVSACPFGVIDQRREDGRVWKCTLCYDRLRNDQTPACAQACPTNSIQYGPLDQLRHQARTRQTTLQANGVAEARLYGDDPNDGVGGFGSLFLLLDEPEVYGLPPDAEDPTRHLAGMWRTAGAGALALVGAVIAASLGRRP
jgi:formate dehydrogenase iron-sulfur subunit